MRPDTSLLNHEFFPIFSLLASERKRNGPAFRLFLFFLSYSAVYGGIVGEEEPFTFFFRSHHASRSLFAISPPPFSLLSLFLPGTVPLPHGYFPHFFRSGATSRGKSPPSFPFPFLRRDAAGDHIARPYFSSFPGPLFPRGSPSQR